MDSIFSQLSLGTLSESFSNERIDPEVALYMSDSALADLGVNTIGDRIRSTQNCAQAMFLIKGKQMRLMKTQLPRAQP